MSTKNGIVNADFLNVRSGTGTAFPVFLQLMNNTRVAILNEISDWFEIKTSALEGYVNRAYVALSSPSDSSDDSTHPIAIVEPDALNMRSGAGYEFSVVTTVYQDMVLEMIEQHSEWSKVKTRKLSGYILKDLLVEIYGGGTVSDALYRAVINDPLVNLRAGAGLNFPVIAVLQENTEVAVKNISYDWAKIETIVYEGYIRSEFIRMTDSLEPDENSITTATVTSDNLRLRSGPNTDFAPFALLKRGTGLKVIDVASDWFRVQPIIETGFASSRYIRETSGDGSDIPSYDDDPVRPPASDFIPIEDSYSDEQKKMASAWNRYGGLLKQICAHYAIDTQVALAVLCVESGGKGYGQDGRLIIRFEVHHFYRHWGVNHENRFNQFFKFDRPNTWQGHHFRYSDTSGWQPVHTGHQQSEWAAFQFAQQFDEKAALKSISMGSPQIMGANFGLLGCSTVFQMYDDFQKDIRNQISGLFLYIQGNNLISTLQNRDFISFAKRYNGQSRAREYGNRIQKYVDEFSRLIT